MAGPSERAWKVRRLLAMSPAEVGLRVMRGVSHSVRRPREPVPQNRLLSAESLFAERVSREDVAERLERELREGTGRLLPGAADRGALLEGLRTLGVDPGAVVAAGDSVLAGELPAFGWTTLDVGETPDWLGDPVTGRRWPLDFWADLEFRDAGELSDPRYVWEVNRHHHLVTLARAYAVSGEARFAARVWRDAVSWVGANPPLFGINWASPLEIAIRLMSWAMALDIVGTEGALDGDVPLVVSSVSLQAGHLSDNLSVYASSRNNHLIGEATGLLVTGAKFPFLRRAAGAVRTGRRLLDRELEAQVTADGVGREQAFHYQSFVVELALLGMAAADCLGTRLAPETVERVGRMSRFLSAVSGMGGAPPSVGDGDGGRAFELSDEPGRQAARAAAVGALAAGVEGPAGRRPGDLEPAVWLFGPGSVAGRAGAESARGGRPEDVPRSTFFREGGYFVPCGARQHGVIDCGPLGFLSIAAHGHADCLSLVVSYDGTWLLVDPGTFCYHRDGKWRDHFRGTRAHNTVSVDGLDQSEMLGPFMWGRRAAAEQLAWVSTDAFDYFEGAHDGFAREAGVRHRRSVVFGKRGYWLVLDHLEGGGRHEVESVLQMAKGFSRRPGEGLTFDRDDGPSVELRTWLPEGLSVETLEGMESPPGGWVSKGFGLREPAPAIVISGRIELPATLITAVVAFSEERTVRVECPTGGWDGGAVVEAEHRDGRDRLMLGAPVAPDGAKRFIGRLGFTAVAEAGLRRWGLGIEKWTADGAEVSFERVTDLLST